MGDFNARVGEGSDGKVIGKYGLGKRNDRGQMLSDFCKKNQLVVTNIVSARKETAIHMDWSSSKKRRMQQGLLLEMRRIWKTKKMKKIKKREMVMKRKRKMTKIKMGEDTK